MKAFVAGCGTNDPRVPDRGGPRLVTEVEMITTSKTEDEADARVNQALTEAECMCLLAGESIGRVVYTDGALPTAFPVNYRLLNRSIVFRTNRTHECS